MDQGYQLLILKWGLPELEWGTIGVHSLVKWKDFVGKPDGKTLPL